MVGGGLSREHCLTMMMMMPPPKGESPQVRRKAANYHHADGALQVCSSPQELSTKMRESMQARKRKKKIL